MRKLFAWWWLVLPCALLTVVLLVANERIVCLKIDDAFSKIGALEFAIEQFRQRHGYSPGDAEMWHALVAADILGGVPRDPWGNIFVSAAGRVYSVGLDGRDSHGAGDDVTTRGKEYRCEDYGVNCPIPLRYVIALVFLGIAAISLLVGIFRCGHFLSKRSLHHA